MRLRSWIVWLAIAGTGAGASGYGSGPGQQQALPRPIRQPANPQVIAQAEAAVASAQGDLQKANQGLEAVVARYRAGFEKTKDWMAADGDLKAAQAALTAARLQVMSNLAQNSDYTAAVADEQKASGDLAMARSSGDAPPDVLGELATTAYQDQAKVKKMEDDAMTADPDVIAAGQKRAEAQQVVDQLNAQFLKSLQDKDDWKTADQSVQEAQKQVSQAQSRLNADSQ